MSDKVVLNYKISIGSIHLSTNYSVLYRDKMVQIVTEYSRF